jgi:hypothetical protein
MSTTLSALRKRRHPNRAHRDRCPKSSTNNVLFYFFALISATLGGNDYLSDLDFLYIYIAGPVTYIN